MRGQRQFAERVYAFVVLQATLETRTHPAKADAERHGLIAVAQLGEELTHPRDQAPGSLYDPQRLSQGGLAPCHRFEQQTFKLPATDRALWVNPTGTTLQ